jgi:hypothetical protein
MIRKRPFCPQTVRSIIRKEPPETPMRPLPRITASLAGTALLGDFCQPHAGEMTRALNTQKADASAVA